MATDTSIKNSRDPRDNTSSFSYRVKEELAGSIPERKCCQEALLASFLFSGGQWESGDSHNIMSVTTGFSRVARMVYKLVKNIFETPVKWTTEREAFFNKRKVYQVFVLDTPKARDFISKMGVGEKLLKKNVRKACCRRAFLAGAFMASGSVNTPERYYHFEIVQIDNSIAKFLVQILARMEITGKITGRKNHYVVYVKKADEIANLLNILGAHNSLLRFEEIRAIKETKEEVRRKVNAEVANMDKTACAATRQVSTIHFLRDVGAFKDLPKNLKEVAELRLRFPEASLKELGERFSPPITKSSVNSRMRRLETLYRRIKRDGIPGRNNHN